MPRSNYEQDPELQRAPYEIQVGVDPSGVDPRDFRSTVSRLGLDPMTLRLSASLDHQPNDGTIPDDDVERSYLAISLTRSTLPAAFGRLAAVSMALSDSGFTVLRKRIETPMDGPMVPGLSEPAPRLSCSETHFTAVTPDPDEAANLLDALLVAASAQQIDLEPARYDEPDTESETRKAMATLRLIEGTRQDADRTTKDVLAALYAVASHDTVIRPAEREFVVFDMLLNA